jgi:hypothetical protein
MARLPILDVDSEERYLFECLLGENFLVIIAEIPRLWKANSLRDYSQEGFVPKVAL